MRGSAVRCPVAAGEVARAWPGAEEAVRLEASEQQVHGVAQVPPQPEPVPWEEAAERVRDQGEPRPEPRPACREGHKARQMHMSMECRWEIPDNRATRGVTQGVRGGRPLTTSVGREGTPLPA